MDSVISLLGPFSFRGKARLLHSLSPKSGERTAEVFGYNISVDLSDYIQRSIYLNAFEPRESALVRDYLKPGMTFVDVGANVGYFTLMAASLVGVRGAVVAFEPSPYAFDRLARTIEGNQLPQVRAIQAALSDTSGTLQIYVPKLPGNHTPTMVANDGGDPIDVATHRLDECLVDLGIDRVDLMKIDVEGFEPNVLRGAKSYLEHGKINAILCEFNRLWLEANKSSPAQLYDDITSYGYELADGRPDFNANLQTLLFTRTRMSG